MASWLDKIVGADGDRPRRDLSPQGRAVYAEVRLAAVKTDGAVALASHMMSRLRELDDDRRQLAKEDATLNLICAEIESEAVQQCKQIQRGLNNPFGL